MIKLKKMKILSIAIVIFAILTSFNVVEASTGGSSGYNPNESGAGTWWHARGGSAGSSEAWDFFVSKQAPHYSESSLANMINRLPNAQGFEGKSLSESCKESQFIWWYGSNRSWTDYNNGGTGRIKHFRSGNMYTESGYTHGLNINQNGQSMFDDSWVSFESYKKSTHGQSNWGQKPGVILICSATYAPQKKNLVIVANSGKFEEDGNYHTVSGWKWDPTSQSIKSGHSLLATVSRTEKNHGRYYVNDFKNKKVVHGNKDVTNEYKINTKRGILIIWNEPPPPPTGPDTRCIDSKPDSATAYTRNATEGRHVYSPGGSMSGMFLEDLTPAGEHAQEGMTLPAIGAPKSQWDFWKQTFLNGSKTDMSPELNLDGMGVSNTLSKHGGVYEVDKKLTKETYNITHCQRQKRHLVTKCSSFTNSDGQSYTSCWQEWSEWYNYGPREVESKRGPETKYEHSGYQLFAVNCNKNGFNRVVNQKGGEIVHSGQGSGFLKTPVIPGRFAGTLGKSGETRNSAFYTDGTSCQEAYNCSSNRLSSASNDADNNIEESPLFTEEAIDKDGNKVHNKTNSKNELVFFRDNEDRTVRADVWYLKNTGANDLFSNPTAPANETLANLYGGTPEISITTIHPEGDESDKLTGIGTYSFYRNHVNKLNVKSQWASFKGEPYKLGLNWKYIVDWKNTIPSKVDGDKIVSNKDFNGNFKAYCEFKNNAGSYPANIPKTPHANGYSNSPKWSTSEALKILFTRSVTDEQR